MNKRKTYYDSIDKETTMQEMKEQLLFLKQYTQSLRFQSVVYGTKGKSLQVEDGLVDYLHYSKSVIRAHKKKTSPRKDPIIDAMMKQKRHQELEKKRDEQAYFLLEGISQMEIRERDLLLDVYVRQYAKQVVFRNQGNIVESTYHRRLRKAYLQLAIILHIETFEI
ncbi:MAG: elastin [Longicatena sp.]